MLHYFKHFIKKRIDQIKNSKLSFVVVNTQFEITTFEFYKKLKK